MKAPSLTDRYQLLKTHVGWTERDAELVNRAWRQIEPVLDAIVDDFYQAIESNPAAAKVITGGMPQIQRLRSSLRQWLRQAFTSPDDQAYLQAQRQIGKRHADLGLTQCFANVAMSRLRTCLCRHLHERAVELHEPIDTMIAVSRRLDLDLALMDEAYQDAFVSQQQPVNQSRLRQQRAIVELSHRALSAAEVSPLLEYAVLLAADVLSADQCAVLEYRESSREFVVQASFGMQLTDPNGIRVSATDYNLAAEILRTRELCLVDDSRDPNTVPVTPVVRHEQVVSAVGVPLWGEQSPWGVLIVHMFQRRSFLSSDRDCLLAMANVLSAALQRKQAEFRMMQAERLAGIGQMITGIAHESRNALQRIQACTEMLQMELLDQPGAAQFIQRIELAQHDLTRLFDEVRNFAAPLVLTSESVNLPHLWRRAWSDLQSYPNSQGWSLQEDADHTGSAVARGDGFRLTQVFRNLFENSLAAAAEGTILVELTPVTGGSTPGFRICISDTGPGFDQEAQTKAFDPFFTTRTKGTGLGLAITRRIIEAHGGMIAIDPLSDAGARIVITLPRG